MSRPEPAVRLLAFAASLRRASWNRRLIAIAAEAAGRAGALIDAADFHEFDVPLFDGDILQASGVPPGALELARRVAAADGVMIASPEYNFSLPGTIKNLIDWLSRMKPVPIRGKTAMLLSASTSQVGGIRGLWQLRIPLEGLGMIVSPDMYALPWADKAFDDIGRLRELERQARLEEMIASYVSLTRRLLGDPEPRPLPEASLSASVLRLRTSYIEDLSKRMKSAKPPITQLELGAAMAPPVAATQASRWFTKNDDRRVTPSMETAQRIEQAMLKLMKRKGRSID